MEHLFQSKSLLVFHVREGCHDLWAEMPSEFNRTAAAHEVHVAKAASSVNIVSCSAK